MKILIFGAGENGKIYKNYIETYEREHTIIGFLDNAKPSSVMLTAGGEEIPYYSPNLIRNLEFDLLVITNSRKKDIKDIKDQLVEFDVDMSKVIVLCEDERLKAKVLASYNRYDEKTDARTRWLHDFSHYVKENNLKGNVAECGVYKGEFAYYINKYFADRKLYLFDTFEGFCEKDLEIERELNDNAFLTGRFNSQEGFQSGGEYVVLERMKVKEKCVIKKGYFPETAEGLCDVFCFVNLDMDLYQPTLEGLRFFYDKMCKGGIILIHDYFHPELPGVKQAITCFEEEIGRSLVKVPIGDFCSIGIIKC